MSTKRAIRDKAYEEMQRSLNLRKYSISEGVSYETGQKVKEEQDKAFKKFQFFKELNKAMNGVKK